MLQKYEVFNKVEQEIKDTLEKFGSKNIRINITEFATKNQDNSAYSLAVDWVTSFGDSKKERLTYHSLEDLQKYEEDMY